MPRVKNYTEVNCPGGCDWCLLCIVYDVLSIVIMIFDQCTSYTRQRR